MFVCIAISAGISAIAIVGWILDWLILAGISEDYIPMALSTALLFIVLSGALFVYTRQPAPPHVRMIARAGVFLVILISLIIFIDFFTGMTFDIERFLISSPQNFEGVPVGRMSPITAANFLLAGSALLLLFSSPAGRRRSAAAFLAAIVISVMFVVLIGYLYGSPLLYGGNIIPVALTTAIVFVFLGIGIILATGQRSWPMNSFIGSSVSARLMRIFLPVTIALALIVNFLDIVIFRNIGNHVIVSSMVTILAVFILGIIIPKISLIIGGDIDRAETERRRAEEALREAEAKYHSIFENAVEGIFQTGLDGRIISANPAVARILGYASPDELILEVGNIQKIHVDPARREEFIRMIREYGAVNDFEANLRCKNDRKIWCSLSARALWNSGGGLVGFEGLIIDITRRKQAEDALRETKARLDLALQSASMGVWHWDIIGDRRYFEEHVCHLLGIDPATFTGGAEEFFKAVHPDDRETIKAALERTIQQDVPYEPEYRAVWPDGSVHYITARGRLVRDDNGRPARVNGIIWDITERKKAEETVHENLRLEAADKAKSEFLANMSHELRTPLNSSIGFSELLKQGIAGQLNDKQKHYVDNILTSNQFLLILINDILDLSKIEAGKIELVIEKIPVPEVIKETLNLIKEKAMKHKVLLKTEFDPELAFIEADKQRVKQVLFNLLSNAVKFSKEEGGTVTITAKKEGDMARISVSDTGIGIKAENIGRLFHKFEQLEKGISEKYGGTGLGLDITMHLVELQGGRIWARSKYGEGSTFTFLIPLVAKKMEGK